MTNKPHYIIVHHSVTPRDLDIQKTESSIQRNHLGRGFPKSSLGWNIGYHYMIYGNGELTQYRKETDVGAHTSQQSMNFNSIGICLIGNFDAELPSEAQIVMLRKKLLELTVKYKIPIGQVVPHRTFAPKSCYGKKLSDTWAQQLITNNMPELKDHKQFIFSRKTGTVYLVKPMPDQDFLQKEANIEGIPLPDDLGKLPDTNSL